MPDGNDSRGSSPDSDLRIVTRKADPKVSVILSHGADELDTAVQVGRFLPNELHRRPLERIDDVSHGGLVISWARHVLKVQVFRVRLEATDGQAGAKVTRLHDEALERRAYRAHLHLVIRRTVHSACRYGVRRWASLRLVVIVARRETVASVGRSAVFLRVHGEYGKEGQERHDDRRAHPQRECYLSRRLSGNPS